MLSAVADSELTRGPRFPGIGQDAGLGLSSPSVHTTSSLKRDQHQGITLWVRELLWSALRVCPPKSMC